MKTTNTIRSAWGHFLAAKGRAKVKKGFTLIEVLVVIGIIAAIAAIAGPTLWGLVTGSKEGAIQSNCDNLNGWLAVAENGGAKWGATAVVGSKGVPGTLPNTSASACITAMKAGIFTYSSGSSTISYPEFRGTVASYTLAADAATGKFRFSPTSGATEP